MRVKEAIILAGGLGTRLQGILPDLPKCMAPVNGKPFLTFVLDYLEVQGINKVILSVGYRNDQIINYFKNRYHSILIEYVIETQPLGTGGAVKLAFDKCIQHEAFVVNGDTYFTPDLQAMENLHSESHADITIGVKHLAETSRYGLIKSDGTGRIKEFSEKDISSGSGWINGGIYLVNKQIFNDFHQPKFSLENDLFKVSCSEMQMQAFKTDAFFLDIGIPEDYAKAQSLISANK
jgi:D-glycero-alpha-D-manno-heptose 1-phosphate guanylyltransferase